MTKAEELINKHLTKECGGDLGIADGNIYKACLGAINEALTIPVVVGQSEQLKAVEKLKNFAYEVCPLHREDDLEEVVCSL